MQTDASGNVSWVDPSSIGASEWTDGGTYLTPGDGIGERVTIGTTTSTGMLSIESTSLDGIANTGKLCGILAQFIR